MESREEALFLGWFGPIGIAAMYDGGLMWDRTADPRPWHIISLAICGSIIVHGATSSPFSRLIGQRNALWREASR